jgi:iron-sulfur cluster repair protein YtfE (RIC family)
LAYTDKYRDQHVELAGMAQQVRSLSSRLGSDDDCNQVRGELSRLAGKLLVHLTMEDQGMYPRLKDHADSTLKATAASFAREMGGIAEAFTAYSNKWTAGAIKADKTGFAAETAKVVDILLQRIQRENSTLYPMVDRLLA